MEINELENQLPQTEAEEIKTKKKSQSKKIKKETSAPVRIMQESHKLLSEHLRKINQLNPGSKLKNAKLIHYALLKINEEDYQKIVDQFLEDKDRFKQIFEAYKKKNKDVKFSDFQIRLISDLKKGELPEEVSLLLDKIS